MYGIIVRATEKVIFTGSEMECISMQERNPEKFAIIYMGD